MRLKVLASSREPSGLYLTVAIDELDSSQITLAGEEVSEPDIASSRCGERLSVIQRNDMGAEPISHSDRPIRRSGVDIDDTAHLPQKRHQAPPQPCAFVAPDNDSGDIR